MKILSGSRRIPGPLVAIGGALALSILAVLALSDNAGRAVFYLLAGPAMNPMAFGDTLASTSRLIIAGTAAAMAFRAGTFNLGGEGQALAGGLAAAALAMALPDLPAPVAITAAVLIGTAAGGLIGAFSGILKSRWNVDELISSFLISAAIGPIGHYLLNGPMKDTDSYLIAAPPLPAGWVLSQWLPPSRLGPVLIWSIVIAAAAWLFLEYSRRGYEWRLRGASEAFAQYGGIHTGLVAVSSMAVSGALFGLAGTAALLDEGQAIQGFTSGLGWDGLAVALIAASRPRWIPVAALSYAWLMQGTESAMIHTGFPYSLSGLVQAAVFLLITADAVFRSKEKSR